MSTPTSKKTKTPKTRSQSQNPQKGLINLKKYSKIITNMNKNGTAQIKRLEQIYDDILQRFHPINPETEQKTEILMMKEINQIVLAAYEEEKGLRAAIVKFGGLR
jgi:hypothetical protein